MKILISNLYSWKNKGDAAIVLCMLQHLKKEFPKAKISLSSSDPDDLKNKPYGNYNYFLNPLTILTKKKWKISQGYTLISNLIKLKLLSLCSIFNFKPYFLFSNEMREKIKSYDNFDLVIACGGGYILTTKNVDLLGKMISVYDFYLAKEFKKPFILYNQSIGPFYKKFHKKFLKKSLSKAILIICREGLTYNRLKKMHLNNICLSTDIAFNLKNKKTKTLKDYAFNKERTNIGITVRNWLKPSEQKNYEKELSRFIIKKLNNNRDIRFYFIPQVIHEKNLDNDLLIAKKITERIPKHLKNFVYILNEDLDPREIKFIISKMDYFIGTRMHSNIFALSNKIKTIAISYEPKTEGIMKMLNLSNYVIKMENLTCQVLIKKFDRLINDYKYIGLLKKKIPKMKRKSLVNLNSIISPKCKNNKIDKTN